MDIGNFSSLERNSELSVNKDVSVNHDTQGVLQAKSTKTSAWKEPEWGGKVFAGLKNAGLALGSLVCGVLAIGLLPFSLIGSALYSAGKNQQIKAKDESEGQAAGKNMQLAGAIISAPLMGLRLCLTELQDGHSQHLKGAKGLAASIITGQGAVANHLDSYIQTKRITRSVKQYYQYS